MAIVFCKDDETDHAHCGDAVGAISVQPLRRLGIVYLH